MTPYELTDLSTDQRAAILADQIERFAVSGWRVTDRAATTAQLIRPKQFSVGAAILWFLLCGFGVLVYLFLYMGQRDEMVWLTIREQGQVRGEWRHGGTKWPSLRGDWTCPECAYINRVERLACLRCGDHR